MSSTTSRVGERRRLAMVGCAAGAGLAMALLGGASVQAQAPKSDALYQHVMKARAAAGLDLRHHFYHRCFVDPNYTATIAKDRKHAEAMEPTQVFDQLYFVGNNGVSAWVLKTSAGLVLFDTQNNETEAKTYVEAGMRKLGLNPADLKYVFIMHEHADHFGGAKYIKSIAPNAHLMASSTAWENMAKPTTRGHDLAPAKAAGDEDVSDGQKITLGDTTLTFYRTPGHTDGTISAIFKVTDHGAPHMVGFFGGMGSPNTEANRKKIMASFARWQGITKPLGVDTLVANHQGQDYSVENLEFIRVRHPSDPNPYVLGKDAYQRYFTVQSECTAANLVRKGGAED